MAWSLVNIWRDTAFKSPSYRPLWAAYQSKTVTQVSKCIRSPGEAGYPKRASRTAHTLWTNVSFSHIPTRALGFQKGVSV